jgi:hypothetical protein
LFPTRKLLLVRGNKQFGPPSFIQFPGWECEALSRRIKCIVDYLKSWMKIWMYRVPVLTFLVQRSDKWRVKCTYVTHWVIRSIRT